MADLTHPCPVCHSLDNVYEVVSSQANQFPGLVPLNQSQVVIRYIFTCGECGYQGQGKLHGWLEDYGMTT